VHRSFQHCIFSDENAFLSKFVSRCRWNIFVQFLAALQVAQSKRNLARGHISAQTMAEKFG
jgi:hypothetical protein